MFDMIIKNGFIIDGSGEAGFAADIAIKDGKIAAIGSDLGDARQVIDATGLTVTPGFIDSHSHADSAVISFPQQIEKTEQGITTSIGGQCGTTPYPAVKDGKLMKMSEFLTSAINTPQGANIAMFAGHRSIRQAVMGMENRPATNEELTQMCDLLRDAMDAGAMGISFGLIYTPSCYADTDELITLAKVAKEKGGMISAHIRNESYRVVEAVEEFITIAKAANIRGVISHHKSTQPANHGKVKTTIAMIEQANREGCDIYCDVYPYIASRTTLSATFIPKEYANSKLIPTYLQNPEMRAQFKQRNYANRERTLCEDLSWVLLNTIPPYPQYNGKRLTEAAKLHGKDPWETLFDILEVHPGCGACYFTMDEADVEYVMKWPRSMICTDSSIAGNSQFYHPRLRGSFPRVLGRYVRERNVVSLPEMIRKMTFLPAMVYGLENKGYLREGFDADICIFDPETIIDRATYTDPSQRAEGLHWVIVGGEIAAKNAVSTGKTAGKVLLRKQTN
ncbi:MAG: D-aminoacylase [Oscillospiraceae bacterium]|nr:D-aminoacylase [Oscillospiraceae bacterium]